MSKSEFLTALLSRNYKADFSCGMPTVHVGSPDEVHSTSEDVRKLADELSYNESFGVTTAEFCTAES